MIPIRTRRAVWRTVDSSSSVAARTLRNGDKVLVDTSSGPVTVYGPASPAAGWRWKIRDKKRTFATNNCTIDRNSLKINGAASNLIVARSGAEIDGTYSDATQGWVTFGVSAALGGSFSQVVLTNAQLNAGSLEVKYVTISYDGTDVSVGAESGWTATPLA